MVRLRISAIEKGLYSDQTINVKGKVDADEEPIDFGVVDLGSGKYLVVNTEDDGDTKKSNFVGMTLSGDELSFYLFDGGDKPAAQAAFTQALAGQGLTRNQNFDYE